jgi:hypothetical protein
MTRDWKYSVSVDFGREGGDKSAVVFYRSHPDGKMEVIGSIVTDVHDFAHEVPDRWNVSNGVVGKEEGR